jgi:carbon storage regulator CsrA
MLVLARREGETLVLPQLDVVLEVLAIKGSVVRLGVQAPSKLKVLRGELAQSREKLTSLIDRTADDRSGQLMHRIRNWLQVAHLRMDLIRAYLEANRLDEAADMLQEVLDEFKAIPEGSPRPASPRSDVDNVGVLPAPPGVSSHRALLVEDNANERQLLAGYLRTSGFSVETAGDGAAALDCLFSHQRPDLVLLDMLMPKCDGPTLLRRIRGNRSFDDLKVFAVSGTSPTTWDIATGPKGVDRWFQKPVDPQFLVREITRELRHATSRPTVPSD